MVLFSLLTLALNLYADVLVVFLLEVSSETLFFLFLSVDEVNGPDTQHLIYCHTFKVHFLHSHFCVIVLRQDQVT